MAFIYSHGFWLRKEDGQALGRQLLAFLQCYTNAAALCLREGKLRFSLVPKVHMTAHSAIQLLQQARTPNATHVISPLAFSVQMQEDFVGRPARLSRRVSVRALHNQVAKRSLINVCLAFQQADEDFRGMQ